VIGSLPTGRADAQDRAVRVGSRVPLRVWQGIKTGALVGTLTG
jgi:hypothetical protein